MLVVNNIMNLRMRKSVLCFVFRDEGREVLLIEKKRGQGAGKWNVPGGKVKQGESFEQAAVRETLEETGIQALDLEHRGRLEFRFPPESSSWSSLCEVFVSKRFEGTLHLEEIPECRSFWWKTLELPFERFWDDDKLWIPDLIAGQKFHRCYEFDAQDHMVRETRIPVL